MDKSIRAFLIGETYTTDSIGQQIAIESTSAVFCNVSSVTRQEWAEAGRLGIKPEYRLTMFAPDYHEEKVVVIDSKRYGVYRTYEGKNDFIELYVEEKAGV